MAKYSYTALKDNTKLIKGEVEAATPREAREKIRQLGFIPTKVYTEKSEEENFYYENYAIEKNNDKPVKHLSLQEKIMFTSELQVLLSSGIPILEALDSVRLLNPKWKLKKIASDLYTSISNGMTFTESLNQYALVFGPVFMGLCKSGEASGELDVTLDRMLTIFRKQDNIKGKIISASIYPCVLIALMIVVSGIFTTFVFPVFAGIMTQGGVDVPSWVNVIIAFPNFLKNFWWLGVMAVAAVSYVLTAIIKTYSFKKNWDKFVLDIPVVSDFIRYINLSNFMTVLHISYDAGIPIMSGLELANKTVGNNVIKKEINKTIELVKKGNSLSESFAKSNTLPSALLMMVSTGEKSGTLGKMMKDAAEVIDKKIDMVLETLTRLFEPFITVVMGIIVLILAVVFYQLYFGMLGSLF